MFKTNNLPKAKKLSLLRLKTLQFFGRRTIAQIEERQKEIRELLNSGDELNLDEIQEELRGLEEEKEALKAQAEQRQQLLNNINTGITETRQIPKPHESEGQPQKGTTEIRNMSWDEAIETEEYRSAWARDMMGLSLSNEERETLNRVNEEYREFTHNTENTQILVPKTVAAGIWRRAEEQYPLWADVRKLRVSGNLTMLKSDGNSVDGRWYTEDEIVDTDKLGFGQMDLTGCELAKAIQVTWKLKKMALPEFEAYIIREIGDRMGISLSTAVYVGKGKPGAGDTFKPEPRGIKTYLSTEEGTPQIKKYEGENITYKDLTGVMALIHSSYVNGATIYANNTTIWNQLANIVDGMGRPMFVADVQSGGVGRIFGKTIKPDAGMPDNEIMIANVDSGYVANINEDITMYREEHVRARLTDYMGYAIVDGDVKDSKAFVILQAATPTV
ncbi:phage major capsid protein [Priestia endophytica]|uniref:phage major capsid protein n=1 Tax=Priestia endophytica TaxID=135735 RepID=UPI002041CBEC|nr:phage major capsid protein [Priestia endophytica]MCM3536589.1 phage major capsid protein [Priestia endophytica]